MIYQVILANPDILAAMQSKLSAMGMISYYDSLPSVVKRRVKALKKLQYEQLKVDAECCQEAYQLEVKFAAKKEELYKKVSCRLR
jgi:nucleosome assembly protein 1-like 1